MEIRGHQEHFFKSLSENSGTRMKDKKNSTVDKTQVRL